MCTLSMRYHFGFSGAPVGDRPLCILVHMGWAQRQVVGVHWAVQGLQSGFPIWIYKSLSGRPAIVTVTACLLLIRDAFRTPWEYIPVDADAHEGDRPQDLYKACEALSGALEAITPGAVDGPEWVDQSPLELSPRLVAVIKSAPQSMEYTRRRKLLKVYPTFDGIPLAA